MGESDKEQMGSWLRKPYFINTDIKSRWFFVLGVGVFIFFFIFLFRPFGIEGASRSVFRFALDVGLLAFGFGAIFHVAYRFWWLGRYDETQWSVYHELSLMIVMVICLGIANYIYIEKPWIYGWSVLTMFYHQLTTLLVGVFPIVVGVFVSQRNQQLKYHKSSVAINARRSPKKDLASSEERMIKLRGGGDGDVLSLDVNKLSFIQAADNYVFIYVESQDACLNKKVLRATMKSIIDQLKEYSFILRSHKSFIVNLDKVERVSGNAQGYKLHLRFGEEPIPVSRLLNKKVKEELMS